MRSALSLRGAPDNLCTQLRERMAAWDTVQRACPRVDVNRLVRQHDKVCITVTSHASRIICVKPTLAIISRDLVAALELKVGRMHRHPAIASNIKLYSNATY